MNRHDAIEAAIDVVMDTFDVGRCIKAMKALNWKWRDSTEPPSEYEFRKSLRSALKDAVKYGGYISGGFSFRFIDTIDETSGEHFVSFRGGFYVEDVFFLDGVAYSPNREVENDQQA